MPLSPTQRQLRSIEKAYAYFNRTLFHKKLPACVMTLGRAGRVRWIGGMASHVWFQEGEEDRIHQITLDSRLFAYEIMEVYGTLVHEMVHLWQTENGQPSKNAFHNREWAFKMREVGLIPSETGKPGGKEIGENVSHYIEEGGRFEKAFSKMPKSCRYELTTRSSDELYPAAVMTPLPKKSQASPKSRRRSSTGKTTYVCPKCGQRAYGGQKLMINCGVCEVAMEPKERE
jgi:hypothetical protein